MRCVTAAGLGILSLLIIGIAVPLADCTSSVWSSEVVSKEYHWRAEKAELRDAEHNESYEYGMLGGMNVAGGDNTVFLPSIPPRDFDLFTGDRLNLSWIVEGDLAMTGFGDCDIHLTILPLFMNGTSFFELLFAEQETLEMLTASEFVNSTITASNATATLKYNDILDVVYVWDTSTGLLSRKEVTAPSGKQLIVVPGKGIGFFAPPPGPLPVFLMTVAFVSCIVLVFRQLSRQ